MSLPITSFRQFQAGTEANKRLPAYNLVIGGSRQASSRVPKTCFQLTLEPLPNWHTPPVQRLRGLLKVALRAFGLKAVEVKPIEK